MASVADKRREYILEELKRCQQVKVSNLSERFGVSEVSIRRDLGLLEDLGLGEPEITWHPARYPTETISRFRPILIRDRLLPFLTEY